MKYITLILLVIICACSAENKEQADAITIEISPNEAGAIKTSSLYSDIYYIKLQTPSGVRFGDIYRMAIVNDRIFILDRNHAAKLLVFDMSGKFIFNISNYGRGPGEMIAPAYFVVDDKHIYIYDESNMKVTVFDVENGAFVSEYILEFRTSSFAGMEGGFVFYNDNHSDYNIVFTDSNFNPIKKALETPGDRVGLHFDFYRNFTSGTNRMLLTMPFDNTIYIVGDNKIDPFISVDFGSYNMPDDFFSRYRDLRTRRSEWIGYAYNITNYYESDDFRLFNYSHNQEIYSYYYSINTGDGYHINAGSIQDDIGIGPMAKWPMEMHDNYLVWSQHPFRAISHLNKLKSEMTDVEWSKYTAESPFYKFIENEGVDDNPYLIFTKLNL